MNKMVGKRGLLAGFLVVGTFLLGGCSNKLSGSVKVTKPDKSSFTISPNECISGERTGFFGVDLRQGESDKQIRVINDPKEGYYVKVNVPGTGTAVGVSKKNCSTFAVSVKNQSSTINDIKNVKGSVKLSCDVNGAKVEADFSFANCH